VESERDRIAGVVLAAGLGTRLRPLTNERPKALCPVGTVPLVDLAVDRVAGVTGSIAVNVHHHRAAMEEHLAAGAGGGRNRAVHVSVEVDRPLGTAGALAAMREWIAGRPVLVVNGDAWFDGSLDALVAGWDGAGVRVLVHGEAAFHERSRIAGALLPWSEVEGLSAEPSGLFEVCWRRAQAEGRLETVTTSHRFVDCGTPADYLAANLLASGGRSVVDPTAEVAGAVDRSVVWDGARVARGERLDRAIRTTRGLTVLVR
jgi:NDP-sugar pyrophosphorylase family protein